jgi:hypothetical protein
MYLGRLLVSFSLKMLNCGCISERHRGSDRRTYVDSKADRPTDSADRQAERDACGDGCIGSDCDGNSGSRDKYSADAKASNAAYKDRGHFSVGVDVGNGTSKRSCHQ